MPTIGSVVPLATPAGSVAAVLGILGGVLSVVGLAFLLVGWLPRRRVRGWVRVPGRIAPPRTTGERFLGQAYPLFEWYDPQGRRHQAMTTWRGFSIPAVGAPVVVLVDPEDPARGTLESAAHGGVLFMVLGGIAIAPGLIALVLAVVVLLAA